VSRLRFWVLASAAATIYVAALSVGGLVHSSLGPDAKVIHLGVPTGIEPGRVYVSNQDLAFADFGSSLAEPPRYAIYAGTLARWKPRRLPVRVTTLLGITHGWLIYNSKGCRPRLQNWSLCAYSLRSGRIVTIATVLEDRDRHYHEWWPVASLSQGYLVWLQRRCLRGCRSWWTAVDRYRLVMDRFPRLAGRTVLRLASAAPRSIPSLTA
jgi:hypothetical protein